MDILDRDIAPLPSPCFLLDESRLKHNVEILAYVQEQSGCTIIAALKAFAMWHAFPLLRPHLRGTAASSPNEVDLARDTFGGEIHAYAPAYSDSDINRILPRVSHLTFNSFSQWQRYRDQVQSRRNPPSIGIRVNPEWSNAVAEIYDPCQKYSRMGVVRSEFREDLLEGIDGLHVHVLCESPDAEAVANVIRALEDRFGDILPRMKWINLGGGQHITKDGYDVEGLIRTLRAFKERWGVEVILEPGEAVVLNSGWLITTVLDITRNGMDLAILDVSAAAHMPDCLEMPYRPVLLNAGIAFEKPHTYRLGGTTCLSGDIVGDYSFDQPLQIGDRLMFDDMMQYTMVKTTFFNGVKHPAIASYTSDGEVILRRTFGYEDFKGRLG